MSGIDYLADTNALIYLLAGNPCMEPFLSAIFGVSVITEMELLSYPDIRKDEEHFILECLSGCMIISFSTAIKERAITLRRKYRIKLPDAIIAATAIEYNVPLITADKGFHKIEELKCQLLTP